MDNMENQGLAVISGPGEGKPGRTLEAVAAEIRAFTAGMLNHVIEIGRRMVEAKEMLPHGQFGDWIKTNTGYSASTANNFMRLYREYGDMQGSLFGAAAESQTIGSLPYTKALALLDVPAEEREAFVVKADAGHISVQELRRKIAEYEEQREKDQAQRRRELDQAERKAFNKELEAARAQGEAKRATERAEAAEKDAQGLREELETLKAQKPEVIREPDPLAMADAAQRAREEAVAEMQGKVDEAAAAARAQEKAAADLRRELAELKKAVPEGQEVLDQAVKEATEKAVAETTARLNKATEEKKKAVEKRKAAEKELADLKARMEKELAEAREQAKKEADADREKNAAELADARRKLQEAQDALKNAAITSDRDMAAFEVLFTQGKENANNMRGILLKIRGRENGQEQAGKLVKAMLALADAIRGCTE